MNIKFRSNHFQLHGKHWTDSDARSFMETNKGSVHEATQHNMNFYKLVENGMLVHVYDAYEADAK
jgi:hypothetical protein